MQDITNGIDTKMKTKNIFAGTILAEDSEINNINFKFDKKIIDCNFLINKIGEKTLYYFRGETIFNKSLDIYNHIAPFIIWKIYSKDISINTEDKIKIFGTKQKNGNYVLDSPRTQLWRSFGDLQR